MMEGYSLSDISAVTGANRNNNGFLGDGSWFIILFLIFAIFGWGGYGYGGFGGGTGSGQVGDNYVLASDFSQLSRQIDSGFASQERKLDGINNGLCSLGYQELQNINGVNTNIFNGTSAIQSTLTQGFAGLNTGMVQQGYENRIAVNGVGTQLASCCCDITRGIDGINYNNATNTCAIKTAINDGIRDVMMNCNNNYRQLHDEIIANRIEDKNAQIQAQQNEISALRLAASQQAQNAYLISELKPCPQPAYVVPNPYCNCNNGCGCGM